MSRRKGDTRYTPEVVENTLEEMLKEARENEDVIFLNQLFENRREPRQVFSEWKGKFRGRDFKNIADTIKKIDNLLEQRVVFGMMKNKLNVAGCIFHLKNNFQYKDKQEVDSTIHLPPIKIAVKVVKP